MSNNYFLNEYGDAVGVPFDSFTYNGIQYFASNKSEPEPGPEPGPEPEPITPPSSIENCLRFTANEDGCSVSIEIMSMMEGLYVTEGDFIYSTDEGNTWNKLVFSSYVSNTINLDEGDSVVFSGKNTTLGTVFTLQYGAVSYHAFRISGSVRVTGDVTSLLNGEGGDVPLTEEYTFYGLFSGNESLTSAPNLHFTTLSNYCYASMFRECTSLVTAPELPATELADSCYRNMFSNCTSLTTAPELPSTTLAESCYEGMFYGCTGLTTAPELPATVLADGCYEGMFENCTSLTTAPELPVTELADSCYRDMFRYCTGLTSTPELPATQLAASCYSCMFDGCTSLTTAHELPATELADYCYYNMFSSCTNLTTAPELPATTLTDYCYESMFSGCESLNNVTALFTTDPYNEDMNGYPYTNDWLSGVSSTGVFTKNSEATWDRTGDSAIPEGWEVQTV